MKQMIKELISSGYLKTPRIIDAFQKIDRKDFVLDKYKDEAYANTPLPIGYGQTISQPLTVAFMLELLQPEPGDKILEVGSGSGWQTALIASIIGDGGKTAKGESRQGRIFAIELIPELEAFGRKNVSKYNFVKRKIAKFFCFNGVNGIPEEAPFDKIITAASGREIPSAWREQLRVGGRLVMPLGDAVYLLIKKDNNLFEKQVYGGFSFVPFIT